MGTVRGPSISPHGAGELKLNLPASWRKNDVLYLTAKDPAGHELWTWSWSLRDASDLAMHGPTTPAGNVHTSDDGNLLVVQTGALELRFSKETGKLVEVRRNGQTIPFGNGPRFVAFRRNDRKYADVAGQSSLTGFAARKEGADVLVEANFKGPLRQTRWRISPDGSCPARL